MEPNRTNGIKYTLFTRIESVTEELDCVQTKHHSITNTNQMPALPHPHPLSHHSRVHQQEEITTVDVECMVMLQILVYW